MQIKWKKVKQRTGIEASVPVSMAFDDVYYNIKDAVGESTYNFLEGCGVKKRFEQGGVIGMGEVGFGTGLNFCITLDAFLSYASMDSVLQYYTVERFPLHRDDMLKALINAYPNHGGSVNMLIKSMPDDLSNEQNVITLCDGRVILHIYNGDVNDWVQGKNIPDITLDCLYLDGFTPAKNPEMWTEKVLRKLYYKCKDNATFATFTASSSVRRILQAVGFVVYTEKGFGYKRNRLKGKICNENRF